MNKNNGSEKKVLSYQYIQRRGMTQLLVRTGCALLAALLFACTANHTHKPPAAIAVDEPAQPQTTAAVATAAQNNGPNVSATTPSDKSAQPISATASAIQPNSTTQPLITYGSGRFIDEQAAQQLLTQQTSSNSDGVSLNFEQAELSDVVQTILGNLLQENYVIGPNVNGKVTFSTAKPIDKGQLLPILELLLSWHNATLISSDNQYHVLSLGQAIPGNLTPAIGPIDLEGGYEVRAVPLQYISPSEMKKLLQPFAPAQAIVSADDQRNLLILAGTAQQLRRYLQTVAIFDVDWLAGMSVGLFPLKIVDAGTVLQELETLFGSGSQSPMAGLLRFMTIDRLNAIVVITPQADYLRTVQSWIDRLDRGGEQATDTRLYVYHVRNVKAVDLAQTLTQLYRPGQGRTADKQPPLPPAGVGQVAPGLKPVEITSINAVDKNPAKPIPVSAPEQGPTVQQGLTMVDSDDIAISAEIENNTLLIRANPRQYAIILNAVERLDVAPLQVLIEARVIEVTLNDALNYGVEWFLKNQALVQFPELETANRFKAGQIGAAGLSYSTANADVGAIITALASVAESRILSAPSVLVLNNQAASITVGQQIPVNSTSISSGDSDQLVSRVQFRDTGVTLNVLPRVNPGGLVFLDVTQSVSTPLAGTDENGNVAVAQRALETQVAVQSGRTIILGGLISEDNLNSDRGVPLLSRIPILGALFGRKEESYNRTEIVVFITPTMVNGDTEAEAVWREYRRKFEYIEPLPKADKEETNTPGENQK